jgi:hypothetical protein
MHPKVSVVMASYNHASFVREAVESVLNQSFADLELVITDDGSPDGTADVIRGISDPRIDFLAFPENHGTCDGINDCIARSRGQYVAMLNSDDFFLPGKIARQVEFLDAHPEIGAVFGIPRVVDEKSAEVTGSSHPFTKVFTDVNRSRMEWLRHFFQFGNCLCHPTMLIRRVCYDKVGLYDPILKNLPDLEMWIRLCRFFDIHVLPEQLIGFRILKNERNTSAPSMPNLARVAWETPQVFAHFTRLPDSELQELVAPWDEKGCPRPPLVSLALAALRIDNPGYHQFALALLRDCIIRDRQAFPIKEYFRLVGQEDPNGAQIVDMAAQLTHIKGYSTLHRLLNRSEAWCKRRLLGMKA